MNTSTKRILRNFLIELIIYAVLLVIYFLVVLNYLGEPLYNLFNQSPWVYAGATLFLIVMQGVFLEWATSFFVSKLGLEAEE